MMLGMDKYVGDKKSSLDELSLDSILIDRLHNSTIPHNEISQNLGLYLKRHALSRILFMDDLYKKIINVNGSIIEFGVRWGQNMALFENFRGIYEPYNYTRKIIGFDTFSGFPEVVSKDGVAECAVEGGG